MAKMTAANFCKEHPWCCFCGGTTPSSNIDHQPARIIFPDKQRPKGLEFPACHICNEQTRADEVLLAFICRFAGSKRPHATRDFHRLKKIFLGVRRGFPGLLERMHGGRRWIQDKGIWSRGGAIKVDDPKIALSLCRIAAKLALAMLYETSKSAAPEGARIHTMWTHSQKEGAHHIENIIRMIPTQAVLRAGNFSSDNSFFLKYHLENGGLYSLAVFHESVALLAHLVYPGAPDQIDRWSFVMAPVPGIGITVIE